MKVYSVEYTKKALKTLTKLDQQTQAMIYDWIGKHLEGCDIGPFLLGLSTKTITTSCEQSL